MILLTYTICSTGISYTKMMADDVSALHSCFPNAQQIEINVLPRHFHSILLVHCDP